MLHDDKKPIIFLGGPITHIANSRKINGQHEELFAEVVELLSTDMCVRSAHVVEDFGRRPCSALNTAIRDLQWIDEASVLLFVFPHCLEHHIPLRTDGTFIELGYAAATQKPAAVFMPEPSQHSLLTQGLLKKMSWEVYRSVSALMIADTTRKLLSNGHGRS